MSGARRDAHCSSGMSSGYSCMSVAWSVVAHPYTTHTPCPWRGVTRVSITTLRYLVLYTTVARAAPAQLCAVRAQTANVYSCIKLTASMIPTRARQAARAKTYVLVV